MNKTKGVIYAILSSSAFGLMSIFAKIAYNNGSNATTVLMFRFLLAAILLYTYGKFIGLNFRINKEQLILIGLIGGINYPITTETLFLAYNYMNVGMATTIHFIYPAFVCILSFFAFKEKIDKNKVMALFLSCFGVYMLVGIGDNKLNIIGILLALFSGVSYSSTLVCVGNKKIKCLDTLVTTFYLCFFAGISMFIFGLITNDIRFNINVDTISCFLGISIISTIIATLLLIKAIKIIGSSTTSILGTFEPIVSIILGILLFKERLTILMIIGTSLILISVFILARQNIKSKDDKDICKNKELIVKKRRVL